MKLLVAAILQICMSDPKIKTEDQKLTCFDKYVNCALSMDVILSDKPEIGAIKRLNYCQYGTVK